MGTLLHENMHKLLRNNSAPYDRGTQGGSETVEQKEGSLRNSLGLVSITS